MSVYDVFSENLLTDYRADYDKLCSIAREILEQKAICQQDPDQDADEEAPEDQAEYDSVLISSAGDLVAAMANALGSDFSPSFSAFYPLIAKYYVCPVLLLCLTIAHSRRIVRRKGAAPSAIAPRPLGAWQKLSPA
jgi:hypothetical protein